MGKQKRWAGVCIAVALLAACSSNNDNPQSVDQPQQPAVCNGPAVEISGAEPRYEPLNPSLNQNYQHNGKRYQIVQDPANFSQTGFIAIYDAEPGSNLTASGEAFDPNALTAAHATLPIPGYVRITNLANGRMIVVRINDRGPYGNDRAISLSRAAADRLNATGHTKVRIDPIIVAQDGTMSGPGTACTTIAKQTYALPARPDLSGDMGRPASLAQPEFPKNDIRAIGNATLQSANTPDGGQPGAPTPPATGVTQTPDASATAIGVTAPQQPATAAPVAVQPPVAVAQPAPAVSAPVTAPGSIQGHVQRSASAPANRDHYVVQVGAVSDSARASQWQKKLSQQFGVPGAVSHNGAFYRVQLGPFNNRQEATALQQRLISEARQPSFVTDAPSG